MGDEFNGNGRKVYLKGTQHNTYEPLSQRDIRLTPDFGQCAPRALGAVPVMSNPKSRNAGAALKVLGGVPDAGCVILSKDKKTGRFQAKFTIRKRQLTTGSYLFSGRDRAAGTDDRLKTIMDTIASSIRRAGKQGS